MEKEKKKSLFLVYLCSFLHKIKVTPLCCHFHNSHQNNCQSESSSGKEKKKSYYPLFFYVHSFIGFYIIIFAPGSQLEPWFSWGQWDSFMCESPGEKQYPLQPLVNERNLSKCKNKTLHSSFDEKNSNFPSNVLYQQIFIQRKIRRKSQVITLIKYFLCKNWRPFIILVEWLYLTVVYLCVLH